MQVVLQSGGLGTRLYPLTKNKPKCFLDINENLSSHFNMIILKIQFT